MEHQFFDEKQLKEQFKHLNQLTAQPCADFHSLALRYPSAIRNLNKNRYKDVLPEEKTRVKVSVSDIDESDYINANFVKGPGNKEEYISSQAPIPHTIAAFWKMIWEYKVPCICMLTKLVEGNRVKADCYWPTSVGETETYGDIHVTLKSTQDFSLITVNKLKIYFNGQSHEVFHLQYDEWSDFGAPSSTQKIRELIRLMEIFKAKGASKGFTGPLVAHCSAGIGRTGTFFTILACLEKLRRGEKLKDLDIMDTVRVLRTMRAGMIQTDVQYVFVHKVLEDIVRENHGRLSEEREAKRQALVKSANGISFNCLRYTWSPDSRLEVNGDDLLPRKRCSTPELEGILRSRSTSIPITP